MSGPLSQIAAQGIQNELTESRSTSRMGYTPFRCRIEKPSSFAMEPKRIEFPSASFGKTSTATITFSADLLTKLYLVVDMSATVFASGHAVDDFGHAMIEEAVLEIGSVQHNIFSGEYLHVLETQSKPYDLRHFDLHGRRASKTIADRAADFKVDGTAVQASDDGYKVTATKANFANARRVYIELPFWFCRDYCNALPLVAMHLSEAKVKIKFRNFTAFGALAGSDTAPTISDAYLLGEYVYLNDASRHAFANMEHRYLITQVQEDVSEIPAMSAGATHKTRLSMNHMVKQLVWKVRNAAASTVTNGDLFSGVSTEDGKTNGSLAGDAFNTCSLLLNNNRRWDNMDAIYHRLVQPRNTLCCIGNAGGIGEQFTYQYSFALDPMSHAPSGTINFSRIENIELQMTFAFGKTAETLWIWAVNYNSVLVKNGVCSLSFSS